jgi:carboxypeptidase family protein
MYILRNIVAIVMVLAACSAKPALAQQPAQPATGTGVIRGRIVAADTGKPLRRARIALQSLDAPGPPRTANTNADGRYELTMLPAGRYGVRATRSGYLELRYGQRRPLEAAKTITLADGQAVERVDFALPRTGLISGRITDEVGDPVAAATVFAMRTEYWQGRRQLVTSGPPSRTDDTGRYRVLGLSPGTYVVRTLTRETWTVTRAGRKDVMTFLTTYFPGTPDVREAQHVTVGLAQQVSGVDFALTPGRTVTLSGTAFDSHGRAVPNVILGMDVGGPNGGIVGTAGIPTVNGDGTFTIREVPPGDYKLKAAGSDEVTNLPIVVGAADIENVALVTSAGWTAAGTVATESGTPPNLRRPQVNVTVAPVIAGAAMGLPGEPRQRTVLNDDWTFSVTAIVGPVRLRVTVPDGWMVKSILHNGRDVADAALEMKSGEQLSGIQVTVTDRVTTVAGQFADDKGVPITDGTVVIFSSEAEKWFDNSRSVRTARPDLRGQYQIRGLPPGDYLAVALEYMQDGVWNDPEYLESIRRYAQKLSLKEGESRTISLKFATP